MAESQNTLFLVNTSAQSSQGATSVQGRAGPIASTGNPASSSGAAFSRVLADQANQIDGPHPGLQKVLQELSRILEVNSGSGPPGLVLASNTLEARQSLPVSGNFLPEHALQRINQLLAALSESGSVLSEQVRLSLQQGLQQGLQQVLNGSSESGWASLEQVGQDLQRLLESSSGSGLGLTQVQQIQSGQARADSSETTLDSTKALPEVAHERLQQLLDLPADSKLALPEQARQRIQQLLDGLVATGSSDGLQGTMGAMSEQAQQQLRSLLEGALKTDSNLPEALPENARQHLQKLLEMVENAETASLANPLTEAIRSIVQEIKIVPAGKTGDTTAASVAVATGDAMKSLNPDSGRGSVTAQMLALRAAHPVSSFVMDSVGTVGHLDKEAHLFARTGLDLQGQTASKFIAMNPVSNKIIEQVAIKELSINPTQTANIQSVEARDFSSLLLPVSSVSPKAGADSQLFAPQTRLEMQQPLQHSEWGRELGGRVVWMTKQQVQTANIKINPAHLGPIEVRVEVKNDTASVSFISQHVSVRDVIESSVPRLREMLEENGINLENVDVADQSSAREQRQQAHTEDGSPSSSGNSSAQNADEIESEVPDDIISASVSLQGAGLIDYYV